MNLLKRLLHLHNIWLSLCLLLLLHGALAYAAAEASLIQQQPPTQADISAQPTAEQQADGPIRPGKPGFTSGTLITTPLISARQDRTLAQLLAPQAASAAPLLTIWSGSTQAFGSRGNPQHWVNILGNVANPNSIASLVYSLNGGPVQTLAMGPDKRRLAQSGDFNVELDITTLSAGANTVVVTATDKSNNSTSTTVTVNYTAGATWPLPYTTDWANAASIQDVAQIVDGQWAKPGDTVRPTWLDYDRLIGIGDLTWTDYEVVVPVTIHAIDAPDGFKYPSNGPGVGILLRWQGHFQELTEQPRTGWQQLGALGWFRWNEDVNKNIFAGLQLLAYYGGQEVAVDPATLPAFATPYLFKMSVQSATGGAIYRFKVWEADQPEPAAWNMQAQGDPNGPATGSMLLVAHHVDASFGNVTVQPLSAIRPQLTVNSSGNGHVQVEPQQADYSYGQVVTVTAIPDNGFMLTDWQGDRQGQTNPLILELTKDMVMTATFTGAAAPYSDDFNRCTLSPTFWNWINPRNDATLQLNGQQAVIAVPGGQSHDVWTGGNFAPRLMQPATNGDLDLVTKFDSSLHARFQLQGMLAEEDADNYLRFDFYHDGSTMHIHAATVSNGVATTRRDLSIATATPLYMRVTRTGDQWRQSYSTDGATWQSDALFVQAMSVTQVGVFAGNSGNDAPAFTASVDYFFTSAAPIIPEDGFVIGPVTQVVGNGAVTRVPNESTYICGQTVTLAANPADGWRFGGWSGAVVGTQTPIALAAAANQTLTATFLQNSYPLTLTTVGEGSVNIDPLLATYPHGMVVTLSATPTSDWRFAGWEGDVAGSSNPVQIIMDRAKIITAAFSAMSPAASYELTTAVTGNGTLDRIPVQEQYLDGAVVTLTAQAADGWQFAGWQGLSGTTNPATVVMTGNRIVTAVFNPIGYDVALAIVGSGTIKRSPELDSYPHGTLLTLTAQAAPGWIFAGWQGDATGSESPTVLTVDQPKQITATFVEAQNTTYSLLVSADEGGSVNRSPALATYPAGTLVTVTALPTTGWHFDHWQGDLQSGTNPLTLTMNRAYAVQALFARTMVTFTTQVEGGGFITSSLPPGRYPYGTQVTVTANPAPDNSFLGWSGDLQGAQPTATVVLAGNKHVIARFGAAQPILTLQSNGEGDITTDPRAPYVHNQSIQLTAIARPGWHFSGWAGDLQGQQTPVDLVLDGDKTVVANFAVDVNDNGSHWLYLPLITR